VPNFTYITADRSSGSLPSVASYQEFRTDDGSIYSQYLAGLVPKLDLSVFDSFADTAGSFVINKAEIVLGNVQTSSGFKPPSAFGLYLTDESNLVKGIVSSLADQNSPLGFNYNRTNNDYLGDAFFYFSQVKDGRVAYNNALLYSSSSNIDQFKINGEDIKLSIYYTKFR